MRLDDLQALTKEIMKELVKRRSLGGYSAEADGILFLYEAMFRVLQHLEDQYPRPKKAKKEDGVS